jgi:energy-coupling factor transport system ATP-binding protein
MSETVLRFERVSFSYGGAATAALRDVSFTLAPGDTAALLGRNGAGKSTLVRLVTGLAQPAAGTVWVGDWETRGRWPEQLAHRVGSVFQHADQQLFARTVREDVGFGPRMLGFDPARCERLTRNAIDLLDLTAVADEHPYDLPPPLRKLAALAGALALEPEVLVLDEPTAGLDRELRARVADAVDEQAAAGAAVLVVTHDLGFATESLARALVLDAGRLVVDAPLAALVSAPERLAPLGLVPPPLAELSRALGLPATALRAREIAPALAARCRF